MFTGLIQSIGEVRSLDRRGDAATLTIGSKMVTENLALGESIAVNGACLTVVRWDTSSFTVDVSPETLTCTTLETLRAGTRVNLERALKLSDRLGGHLVTGHIDSIGTVVQRSQQHNAVFFEFSAPPETLRYIVAKGSVAIDGISLTVNGVDAESFCVTIIPHSLEQTCLKERQKGDAVNIETDLIGRYVERFLAARTEAVPSSISRDFLARNGFL